MKIFISSGIRAPHCRRSHSGSKFAIQTATMTTMRPRVNSGRRSTYERARSVLKLCIFGIAFLSSYYRFSFSFPASILFPRERESLLGAKENPKISSLGGERTEIAK